MSVSVPLVSLKARVDRVVVMSNTPFRLADQVIAIAIARVKATAVVFSQNLRIVAVLVD